MENLTPRTIGKIQTIANKTMYDIFALSGKDALEYFINYVSQEGQKMLLDPLDEDLDFIQPNQEKIA